MHQPFLHPRLQARKNVRDTDGSKSVRCFTVFPIIVAAVCPTGPYPLLRLARRPDRAPMGGRGLDPSCGSVRYRIFINASLSIHLHGELLDLPVKRAPVGVPLRHRRFRCLERGGWGGEHRHPLLNTADVVSRPRPFDCGTYASQEIQKLKRSWHPHHRLLYRNYFQRFCSTAVACRLASKGYRINVDYVRV